jgi:hypothetical protein
MSEDISVTHGLLAESEKIPGYVKYKIKSQNRLNRGSRARKAWRGSLAKVIKKAASIAELLTEDDQQENLRVIREAKCATHRVFNLETKKMENLPDHKTQLAAVMLDLAYREGKPVERQMSLSGKFEDLLELQERVAQSQAFKQLTESSQKTVEKVKGKQVDETSSPADTAN